MLSLTFNVLLAEAGYVDPAPPVPGPPHYLLAGVGGKLSMEPPDSDLKPRMV